MNNPHFSFIILTFNEEQHLPRLLESIRTLKARTYVLDSGSTDQTLNICYKYNLQVRYHPFHNHPKQWDTALRSFNIQSPWVIGLDADHIVGPELCEMLKNFKAEEYTNINGIYFNRKNYFKGKWIRFGGYYPKYLLKMFRYQVGYSDLQENMDHRFQVPSKTIIWKKGFLIEENLKENKISFWLDKHNRYSDLVAEEEIQRLTTKRFQVTKPNFWGSPNEHNAWLKSLWWQLPIYLRPFLYFTYRMIFQLGFLDGRTGIMFHFLQGFWFRLIVDIKIDEKIGKANRKSANFIFSFLFLFLLFYGFNLINIGITTPGNYYISFLDKYFNYISSWRNFCISSAAYVLKILGYRISTSENHLINHGFSGFRLVYSCLGYGIMSCFAAFVIAFPKSTWSKMIFLVAGLTAIQLLNTLRFILISIYYQPHASVLLMDHHDMFNYILYVILGTSMYFWTGKFSKNNNH
ncbi:exosortase Y [Pedobacter psychroterrae]|uniref:Glycosyltransferase n=1 Tax=Pedobacter psychroterrae TaxID=2530453 RepID=A0A4R0NLM2_9SPHI|nr:glycosyltransferase [Pedobacter psychroterrae]TCD00798.1 glycosyltransferase [Pedobacter psychroterrae]